MNQLLHPKTWMLVFGFISFILCFLGLIKSSKQERMRMNRTIAYGIVAACVSASFLMCLGETETIFSLVCLRRLSILFMCLFLGYGLGRVNRRNREINEIS